jgi:FkbM family methyltransferase
VAPDADDVDRGKRPGFREMTVPQYDWFAVDGDNTLALDWPGVDENSVVWEIGGYKGRWALQMAQKYNPTIHFFEPMKWALDQAEEKLKGYKVHLHNFALWTHNGEMSLGDFGRDGASLLKPDNKDQQVVLAIDIEEVFQRFAPVDVCLMNIEGGEFVLVPYMIGLDLMKHIRYFWAQFHLFVPGSDRKLRAIQEMMSLTHEMIWDCGSTAMAWRRR